MEVVAYRDPVRFSDIVRPLLMADEARHNLMLGICAALVEQPELYPEFHLWAVQEGAEPVGAALRTPPFNLTLSRPVEEFAPVVLAETLHERSVNLPGVTAAVPEVDVFAEAWSRVADADAAVKQPQRIYQLRSVRYTGDADGRMRKATLDDGKLVVDWVRAFQLELAPGNQAVMDQVEQGTAARLRSERGGFFLWETSEPVSLVGCGSFTPNGARIGPVYTPPAHRNRGYATALTASVSAWALGSGRRFCFLYTDPANPTSNRIYQRIGYEPVCDSKEYRFTPKVDGKVRDGLDV